MDPRGYSEPTDHDLIDRLAARVKSWSRLVVGCGTEPIPTQADSSSLG